jgi:RsiW-degrading membrane proteinase PrsW (M82 family)
MLAVVILTLVLLPIRRLLAYSRLLGLVVLSGTCVIIGLLALQFTARELVLTDIAIFLSPQTLLSRFAIWGEYARFNTINMLQGYGAGFFDAKSVIIDNQFLYSYLELGAIPTVAYFVLAASLIYRNSNRSIEVLVIMFLLGCVFLFGDMLSSIMVMYTIGVLFGTTDDRVRLQTAGNCTHTVPTGNTERVE